jgi:hypothetical protein
MFSSSAGQARHVSSRYLATRCCLGIWFFSTKLMSSNISDVQVFEGRICEISIRDSDSCRQLVPQYLRLSTRKSKEAYTRSARCRYRGRGGSL